MVLLRLSSLLIATVAVASAQSEADRSQCRAPTGTGMCETLMNRLPVVPECECYNFCLGNLISCDTDVQDRRCGDPGSFVAGCILSDKTATVGVDPLAGDGDDTNSAAWNLQSVDVQVQPRESVGGEDSGAADGAVDGDVTVEESEGEAAGDEVAEGSDKTIGGIETEITSSVSSMRGVLEAGAAAMLVALVH